MSIIKFTVSILVTPIINSLFFITKSVAINSIVLCQRVVLGFIELFDLILFVSNSTDFIIFHELEAIGFIHKILVNWAFMEIRRGACFF